MKRAALENLPAKYQAQALAQLRPKTDLGVPALPAPTHKEAKRLRQSEQPLMNKLETEFHLYLLNYYVGAFVFVQAKKFKLGNGVWYCPDFMVNLPLSLHEVAFEVKGFMRDDAGVKLKIAATMYPQIKWVLVWKEPKRFGWQFQTILS